MTPVPIFPRPTGASATKAIGRVFDRYDEQLDAWLAAPSWPNRMALFNGWCTWFVEGGTNTNQVALLLTAWLEQLGERSIDTLESALCYRFSLNPDWQAAAMRFLTDEPDPLALSLTYPAFTLFGLDRYGRDALS